MLKKVPANYVHQPVKYYDILTLLGSLVLVLVLLFFTPN
jgi:hypothetical protein